MTNRPVTSPKGDAIFPNLNKPDTKFDEEGVYSVTLRLKEDDATDFIERIDAAMDQAEADARKDNPKKKIKRADPPYSVSTDKNGEEIEGYVDIRFKSKAKNGERKVAIFDANGKLMPNPPLISMGSTIKVSTYISPFYTGMVGAGVSMRIAGVQLIELRGNTMDAEYLGFGAEEGGYVQEEDELAMEAEEGFAPDVPEQETDDFL